MPIPKSGDPFHDPLEYRPLRITRKHGSIVREEMLQPGPQGEEGWLDELTQGLTEREVRGIGMPSGFARWKHDYKAGSVPEDEEFSQREIPGRDPREVQDDGIGNMGGTEVSNETGGPWSNPEYRIEPAPPRRGPYNQTDLVNERTDPGPHFPYTDRQDRKTRRDEAPFFSEGSKEEDLLSEIDALFE